MEQTTSNAKTDETSLPSSDANVQVSSPVEQAAQEQSEQQSENTEHQIEGAETATDTTEDSAHQEQQSTEQQEQPTEAANVVLDKQEDASLPFHKHPRFQEVIAEKQRWQQQYEQSKPLADQATVINNILAENNIPAQEFSNAIQYLIALRQDPAKARAMLEPTFVKLSQFTGDRLPQDLEAEVAAGTLSKERATEMARYRGQQEYQQWRQQGQQQIQQTQMQSVVKTTIDTVVSLKQQIDPDFKPGSELFKQVELRVKAMPLFNTAAEAQKGIETAYSEAKAFLKSFAPRTVATQQKRPPQTKQTANNGGGVMKTSQDVLNAIKRGVRPSEMRY